MGLLNNDKDMDILTVSEDQTTFHANYFNAENFVYTAYGPYKFNECPIIISANIGMMQKELQDIILVCQKDYGDKTTTIVVLDQISLGLFEVATDNKLTNF